MIEIIEPWLSRDDRKRTVFLDDPYFWEGLACYRAAARDAARDRGRDTGWDTGWDAAGHARAASAQELARITFLLVKPEAFAARKTEHIADFVQAAGFRIVGAWPLRMGRHDARTLWRYSLNTVPIAHIRVLELLVGSGHAFLLGLRRETATGHGSAAQMLAAIKGTSGQPQDPGTLRGRLGCPALMLNFVHAPDGPADALRELSVLCVPGLLEEVIQTLLDAGGWPAKRCEVAAKSAGTCLARECERYPEHDLDPEASRGRIRAWLRDHPATTLGAPARRAVETGRVSAEMALDAVRSLELAEELPRWDRVVFAAYLVDELRTGRRAIVR